MRDFGDIRFGCNTLSNTASTKFLGIQIDENLNFNQHIDCIASKISKLTGVLFRLNKFFPEKTLKMLYNALILPHLQYGLEVWYSCSETNRNRIFTLQKRTIRAIRSLQYRDHTNDHFKSLNLLKLEDLYKMNILIDFHHKNDSVLNRDQHHYFTRNRNDSVVPFFNRTKCQRTWLFNGVSFWNNLPITIKEIKSSKCFKTAIKNHLLDQY